MLSLPARMSTWICVTDDVIVDTREDQMARHRELSSRILRTIVMAGAMLGIPLAAAEPVKPAAVSVDDLKKQLDAARAAVKTAKTNADRDAARAKADAIEAEISLAELQRDLVD